MAKRELNLLSDIQLRKWLRAGAAVARSDGGGLTFTLSAAGAATWVLRYRLGGRRQEVTIGRYPDVTLSAARAAAAKRRVAVGDASLARLGRVRKGGTPTAAGETDGQKKNFETLDIAVLPGETLEAAAERLSADIDVDKTSFDEARRIKEVYLALLNRLDYDKRSGLVVMVEDVAKLVGEEYAKVRTRLLAIPSNYAPQIHRCKTVSEVNDMMERAIVEALEELTQGKDPQMVAP
ncbi:MAG TPA: Arm DNA-binding domain-containing protein [Paraburkholderia sp.]|jgi:hypothetical protein